MPKSQGKYYAVKVGRGGPKIYDTWEECFDRVKRYPNNKFKSFRSLAEAQEWLNAPESTKPNPPIGVKGSVGSLASLLIPDPDDSLTSTDSEPSSPNVPSASQVVEPPVTEEPEVSLSLEQALVLGMVKSGGNVFFTGSAGTGKSVLLRQIISWARGRYQDNKLRVAVTASTGMAAVNVGGVTLHSWAGIGLGNGELKAYVESIKFGSGYWIKVRERWESVETLIIDEISMIDAFLFDKLEHIARSVRGVKLPFGGIQLILSGDFFQLPPVDLNSNNVQFAFQAESWKQCIDSVTTLTRVFRQKEQSFVELLNEMRFGKLSERSKSRLMALSRELKYPDSVEPTELFPTKREVQFANDSRLAKLRGMARTFWCNDHAGQDDKEQQITPEQAKSQLNRCVLAPETMALKVGAQVMLIKNVEQGVLVNGSVGKVTDFLTCQQAKEVYRIEVALSPRDKEENPRTREVWIAAPLWENQTKWPVVEFPGGRKRLIPPHEFTVENVDGTMHALRLQVPLILAWAISIHKSQGQTLQRVRVNLGRIFEKGQAYVALSRATSLRGLQILNFDPSKVMAHQTVLNWHEQNVERDRKARASVEEIDHRQAVADSAGVDSDLENDW